MTSCLGFALKYARKIVEEGRHQRKQIGQMFIIVEAALMGTWLVGVGGGSVFATFEYVWNFPKRL